MNTINVSLDDIIEDITDTINALKKEAANQKEPENIEKTENSEEKQALKCCPFCGSKAKLVSYCGFNYVRCLVCTASTATANTEEKAVQLWNKRYIPHLDDIKDCVDNIKLDSETLLGIVKLLK